MLEGLQIRNFAIIDEVDVEFRSGMTVLTGETGAGKSILVDAMGLVLGERGSSNLVRKGAKRAEFTAEFCLSQLPKAKEWLEEQMLDADNDCVLRRVINNDGRSRAFINGNKVPLQNLKKLGEMLLDIHGQHFHQSLGNRNVQRDLLDHFGELNDLALTTMKKFVDWKACSDKLQVLEATNIDRQAELELLQFQIRELKELNVQPGEFADLREEQIKLQNSGRLIEGTSTALELLYEADPTNAQTLLAEVTQSIETLSTFDESLSPLADMLHEATIQVSEAADSLRRYGQSLDMDSARRDFVEERLDTIKELARKHRIQPDDLDALHNDLSDKLHHLTNANEYDSQLRESVSREEKRYQALAKRLSAKRRKAAKRLSEAVTEAMKNLGMPDGIFVASIEDIDPKEPRSHGLDQITFLISANAGQAVMPLSKVASGGELSRMSLAIQVIASAGSDIPTMVFDEVDSGVGGSIAEMVGLRLYDLGQTRQVFCVTHLPQVASYATNHFRIVKISDGKSTKTKISLLTDDERIEEIARMLGGIKITARTREHAAEMLAVDNRKVAIIKSA
ncbi:MAG: DNA repair protein RecN [Woeseia sp.]|nr:DNA repair protein RecN [Woeseia sp.]|tara:strand:- start:2002 stop:3699 length:1698 start_codon:yes stop_codon:yes gene_type:complete